MSEAAEARLRALVVEQEAIRDRLAALAAQPFLRTFPDCGPACKTGSMRREDHVGLCRVLYRQHTAFMAAGAKHRERLFLAANQIGKTLAAAFEVTAHMTGEYPDWWGGYRFDRPTEWWLAGDTMLSTRNVLQVSMLGKVEGVQTSTWTGMIPADRILNTTRKSGGVSLCIDKVWVRHKPTGKSSTLEFLSYDQGRKVFQGTGRDGIWLDEEPPDAPDAGEGESNDIYSECLLRTITRDGIVIATFTPLRGLTAFVQSYLETAVMPDANGVEQPANNVLWPEGDAA